MNGVLQELYPCGACVAQEVELSGIGLEVRAM